MAIPASRATTLRPPQWQALLRSLMPLALGVALAAAMHFLLGPLLGQYFGYYANILCGIGINVILAVSLTMVNGFTGQFSIGHAGFMALGAYAAGAVTYYGSARLWGSAAFAGGVLSNSQNLAHFHGPVFGHGDILFLIACLLGGLLAAVAGVLVGLPSLRLRGDYLAIVTLGFGEIVRVLLQLSSSQVKDVTEIRAMPAGSLCTHLGGALGFTGVPFYTTVFWVWTFVTITLLAAYRLKRSSYGRALLSIRENEIAASSVGVPVTRYKVTSFVIAAFFAGLGGGLYAHMISTFSATEMAFQKSFDIVIMVVLGGMGSISGAALAAAVVTILPELLRDPPHAWPAGLVAVVLVLVVRRQRGLRTAMALTLVTLVLEARKFLAESYNIQLSDYRMVLYALCLILMMILRPQGLLGLHEVWDLPLFHRRAMRGAPVT